MSRVCSVCGKPVPPARRGRTCSTICAQTRVTLNARQLQEHKGPYYDRWKQSVPWTGTLKKEEE